ncbi:MAG: mandelate racemase/muconate lactonizing enzyme family protein [Hoeflea sp.]|uniref:mandelate racemase/muconate lactonizing enzyme family protein n=1 Tax=Hoeflea sp. TaxID=1940281 RepID=UPI002730495B|nr:mandelate racemase/muconate lactonizing enzyme family protein [Hoeflea sp.]MDP2118594.1 mandelate racemase/muconate lactonizing enzyme family protein [Hoeflea sp.]
MTPEVIRTVETILLSIPFADGGAGEGLTPSRWSALDIVLVRIETSEGRVGWGEAFGYFCAEAVKAMMDRSIAPLMIGKRTDDPAALGEELQRRMALFGRYGVTMFALSGVDIALWDLRSKAAGKSLGDLLSHAPRDTIPAYASLVRYGDAGVAAAFTERAVSEGYGHVKLHEITKPEIAACDAARGNSALMVDVNCSWSQQEARSMARWLSDIGCFWLEEPIFPPEDFDGLADLAREGLALSAGENLCTHWQFAQMITSAAIRYPQPSVTKVGGVSEFLKIATLAERAGLTLMPHSPYFGPGYLATLQLCSILPGEAIFEHLYVWPAAQLYPDMPLPVLGRIARPTGPGLGIEPDPAVIARYRTA